jgi:hypothetical protein
MDFRSECHKIEDGLAHYENLAVESKILEI